MVRYKCYLLIYLRKGTLKIVWRYHNHRVCAVVDDAPDDDPALRVAGDEDAVGRVGAHSEHGFVLLIRCVEPAYVNSVGR